MNEFCKFIGCNKIVCIKAWRGFDAGKTYNLEFKDNYFKIIIDDIRYSSYEICDDNSDFDVYTKNFILKSFCTVAELRNNIINDLID